MPLRRTHSATRSVVAQSSTTLNNPFFAGPTDETLGLGLDLSCPLTPNTVGSLPQTAFSDHDSARRYGVSDQGNLISASYLITNALKGLVSYGERSW